MVSACSSARPHRRRDRTGPPRPQLPGRDLVRLTLPRATDPIRDVVDAIAPIARRLGPGMAATLTGQATAEMTRHGWNPKGAFTTALHRELGGIPHGHHPAPPDPAHPVAPDHYPTL